jgi:tetratricopeptide (TPR) repeat protein
MLVAYAHSNYAVYTANAGRLTEALPYFRRAMEILEADARTFPEYARGGTEVAVTHLNVGLVSTWLGELSVADGHLRKAVDIFDRVGPALFARPRLRERWRSAHRTLARNLERRGDLDEALVHREILLQSCRRSAAAASSPPSERRALAWALRDLADVEKRRGRGAAAVDLLREARAIAQEVPPDTTAESAIAEPGIVVELGSLLLHQGAADEGERLLRDAIQRLRRISDGAKPGDRAVRFLGAACNNLALHLQGTGRPRDAIPCYREAASAFEAVVREDRNDVEILLALAAAYEAIAGADAARAPSEAERESAAAVRSARAAVAVLPTDVRDAVRTDCEHRLHEVLVQGGAIIHSRGRPNDAEVQYLDALGVIRDLLRRDPKSAKYRFELQSILARLGTLHHSMRRGVEAEREFRAQQALVRALVAEDPANAGYRRELGGSLCNVANALRLQGLTEGVAALYEEAIRETNAALELDASDPDARRYVTIQYHALFAHLLERHEHERAADVAAEWGAFARADVNVRLEVAKMLLECAQAARRDVGLRPAARDAIARAHAERADRAAARLIEDAPRIQAAFALRAWARVRLDDWTGALDQAAAARKLGPPRHIIEIVVSSIANARLGKSMDARMDYERAVCVLEGRNDAQLARELLREAREVLGLPAPR